MSRAMKTIARCEKCGRGFITTPNDMIDHYGVPSWRPKSKLPWQVRPNEWPSCGGRIMMLDTPEDVRPLPHNKDSQ